MKRVLVLLAHPDPAHSRVNSLMAAMVRELEHVTLVDLYAEYPRFKIDIDKEQKRLLEHDVIVFQFPVYWYSTPALLKEWQDLVLEFGFAYGKGGDRLAGKLFLVATTAGAAEEAYSAGGSNRFPIRTLLAPLEQMASLCQMHYLPPLVLFASLTASADDRLTAHVRRYRRVLEALCEERLDLAAAMQTSLMPDLPDGGQHG